LKYELFIERRAQKQLADIAQPYQDRIVAAMRNLSQNPRPVGVKRLAGREGWRIRVGDYRVLYEIRDESLIVLVVAIGHRREVYHR
jgi:mRNA interferase RelE/StbE